MMKVLCVLGEDEALRRDVALRLARELSRRRYQVALWDEAANSALPDLPPGVSQLLLGRGLLWPQLLPLSGYLPQLQADILLSLQPLPELPQLLVCANLKKAAGQRTPYTLVVLFSEPGQAVAAPCFNLRDAFAELVDYLLASLPPLLPFPDGNPCCGKCGVPDCPALLRQIIAGNKTTGDCVLQAEQRVVVKINGRPLPLVTFAQDIVRQTLSGLLSTLDGYEENATVEVTLKG